MTPSLAIPTLTQFRDASILPPALTYRGHVGRLRSVATRHRRRLLHLIMLLAGLVVVAPLIAVDPGVLALLLDVDFVALIGVVGLGLLRSDLRRLAARLGRSLPAVWVRVGVELTRTSPNSLTP
jgi:hypothetical protein